jgi:hypothetical protein
VAHEIDITMFHYRMFPLIGERFENKRKEAVVTIGARDNGNRSLKKSGGFNRGTISID